MMKAAVPAVSTLMYLQVSQGFEIPHSFYGNNSNCLRIGRVRAPVLRALALALAQAAGRKKASTLTLGNNDIRSCYDSVCHRNRNILSLIQEDNGDDMDYTSCDSSPNEQKDNNATNGYPMNSFPPFPKEAFDM